MEETATANGMGASRHKSEVGASVLRHLADLKHLVAALEKQADGEDFPSVTLSCTTTSLSYSLLSRRICMVRLAEAPRPPCRKIRHELLKVKDGLITSGFDCYIMQTSLSVPEYVAI